MIGKRTLIDVKNAFIIALLSQEIYIAQPEGFKNKGISGHV